MLSTGSLRAYCVECHPLVSCGSKKALKVPDLRAAYQHGTLDRLLKGSATRAMKGCGGDALLKRNIMHGHDSDSLEVQEPESDEWSEGNFE